MFYNLYILIERQCFAKIPRLDKQMIFIFILLIYLKLYYKNIKDKLGGFRYIKKKTN